jgi:hypothetical protein
MPCLFFMAVACVVLLDDWAHTGLDSGPKNRRITTATSMHIANPKSFVAGSLVVVMAIKTMFQSSHVAALHTFNLVLLPVVSVFCFWHAFMGQRPLLGRSEIHTSLFLGALSLMLAAGFTFLGVTYRRPSLQFLFAVLFCAAATFYFYEALRERRSSVSQNPR